MTTSFAAVGASSTAELRAEVSVSVCTDDQAAAWDRYVGLHPDATVDHVWAWRRVFLEVFKQRCEYLAAWRGGKVVGVLPLVLFRSVLFGRFAVSVPYLNYGGMLSSGEEASRALIERATAIATTFGATHVELRHQDRQLSELPFRSHKVRMVLPLPATAGELWTDMDRKVRNQVKKAQKEGLTAAIGGAELLPEFYGVFARNMRDLGTPVYGMDLFRAVLSTFGDRARIHVVRRGQQAIAASLTVAAAATVIVPWASALREYRSLSPNMLLYWSMLEGSIERGAQTFDFGRSTRGAGTHQFKLQWGATETALHWEYVLLSRNEAPDQGPGSRTFAAAVEVWKHLPLWLTNRIGPALVGSIP